MQGERRTVVINGSLDTNTAPRLEPHLDVKGLQQIEVESDLAPLSCTPKLAKILAGSAPWISLQGQAVKAQENSVALVSCAAYDTVAPRPGSAMGAVERHAEDVLVKHSK